MNMVNDYIMYRLIFDEANRNRKPHRPLVHQVSTGIYPTGEPFCSPVVPHVPIRQRLSNSRRCTSVDVNDYESGGAANGYGSPMSGSGYGGFPPRRRRMSLLQTLRQQNKQLADSGFDVHQRARTDSDSTRDTNSPPNKTSPPQSPKKPFASIKAKTKALFGTKEKIAAGAVNGASRRSLETRDSQASMNAGTTTAAVHAGADHDSCNDLVSNGRSRKSPSTTNDSGRGSQGALAAQGAEREAESQPVESHVHIRKARKGTAAELARMLRRTLSCPDVIVWATGNRAPLVDEESEDDGLDEELEDEEDVAPHHPRTGSCFTTFTSRQMRNSSPITAADCLLERRLQRKAAEMEQRRRVEQAQRGSASASTSFDRSVVHGRPPLLAM